MLANDDETTDGANNETLAYLAEVQKAIDKILPSDDPLDKLDFDTIDFINNLFPTEQSLTNIDDVINSLECNVDSIDNDMRSVIRGQIEVNMDGKAELKEVQRYIKHLFSQIREIKQKAEHGEEIVREITLDIKQLDCAKKNLTTSLTTLNKLHMLVSGIESLRGLTTKRKYGEIVMPLQGVTDVMKHFKNYTDIPHIAQLATEVKQLQESLAIQIMADFREAFSGPNAKNFVPSR